jgi:S-(hydroxymethyl)mycothiol dehydrogenase
VKAALFARRGLRRDSRDFPQIVALQQHGQLDLEALVTRRVALEDVNDAFHAMQAGDVARRVIVY